MIMLVSLGGVVLGSKDVMAVSRAWGQSFAGLRRLHSMRSVPIFSTRTYPTFEPIVKQILVPSGNLRFISQATAVEESPDSSHKRAGRLSRAERYALVEAFVLKHKEAHEGNWPSLNAILKETGGSRIIVKDIMEELEKKINEQRATEVLGSQENFTPPKDEESHHLEHDIKVDSSQQPLYSPIDENEIESDSEDSESILEDPVVATNVLDANEPDRSTPKSREIKTLPGLWSRLRSLGNTEKQIEQAAGPAFESHESEGEDDANEGDFSIEDLEESKEVEQRDLSWNQTKSSRSSSDPVAGENFGLFIRFLPLSATEADLRAAFSDCGEIVRAQAMIPKGSGLKFTYGFVDFSTPEALSKALNKDKVSIKGSIILTEACSGSRRADSRLTTGSRQPREHLKKLEPYRSSDRNVERPTNGFRSPVVNKGRRVDCLTGNENGSHSLPNNGSHSLPNNASYLVAVEGLPYPMPMSAVEKILSAHGAIYRSELAREDGGTYSALVEFKTEEGRGSALATGRVYLAGRWCRVSTGEPILTTVIRLSNVGNVSENFILQRCGKLGRVDNIVQRKEGVVDVYYHPSERRNMRKILDRLGEANADFKRWHANIAPKCSLEEIRNSAEVHDWVEVQKDRLLENLASNMKLMIIDLEDLWDLVDSERRDRSVYGKPRHSERLSAPKMNRT